MIFISNVLPMAWFNPIKTVSSSYFNCTFAEPAEPPSEYDSSGVLDTAWASLQEVRLMTAANDAPPNTAAAPTSVQRPSPVSAARESLTPAKTLPDQGSSAAASPSVVNGSASYLDRQRKRPSLPTLAQLQSQPRPEVLTPTAVKVGGLGPPRRDAGLPSSGPPTAPRASGGKLDVT